jgi:hypothetical protein
MTGTTIRQTDMIAARATTTGAVAMAAAAAARDGTMATGMDAAVRGAAPMEVAAIIIGRRAAMTIGREGSAHPWNSRLDKGASDKIRDLASLPLVRAE